MKNILLPTDFSDNAWSAVVYALKLYANENCTFYLLHSTYIIETGSRTYITNHYVDDQRKLAEKRLIELKEQTEIANANTNHNFKVLITEEELKFAIQNAIVEYRIDIIVMGTKGTTDAIDYFMGSNTINVIHQIKNCPVLIVPDEHEFVEPKQITFTTDYNHYYDGKEISTLKDMSDLVNSKIRIVHINVEKKLTENQEYNMTMLGGHLADHKHSFHWLPNYTNKSRAISAFIEDLGIDMLALVNYKHGILQNILNEPVLKKLAIHPTVPILVIPE